MDLDNDVIDIKADLKPVLEDRDVEPDEIFAMPDVEGDKLWMIKVPKFLRDAWAAVDEEGVQVATLRIYNTLPGQKQKISILLPTLVDDKYTADCPREYDLVMQPTTVQNVYAFGQRNAVNDDGRKVIKTMYAGKVNNEGLAMPVDGDAYARVAAARRQALLDAKRSVKASVGRDERKLMTAGGLYDKRVNALTKSGLVTGPRDRLVRMPRNELLDMLFSLFAEYTFWTMGGLKQRTKQPEAYLKQVLEDIANFSRTGPYARKWSLKADQRKLNEAAFQGAKLQEPDPDMQDEDLEEDDDFEMQE